MKPSFCLQVVDEAGVSFLWQKGDAVLIDNLQVLHGRSFFTPPRRILASLYKNPDYTLSENLPQPIPLAS